MEEGEDSIYCLIRSDDRIILLRDGELIKQNPDPGLVLKPEAMADYRGISVEVYYRKYDNAEMWSYQPFPENWEEIIKELANKWNEN